ncbi:hypothetical protein D1007_01406 [Hordeum vulgare]|nr:hypothetical protein D1007_01406 [Hordeum vulgare]
MPVSADLATDALVGVVTDDAAQQALMDAEMPTTFPADATSVEEVVARFIDNLSKQIFQAEDALTEGYDKPGGGVTLHPGDGPPAGGVLQRLPRLVRVGVEEDPEGVSITQKVASTARTGLNEDRYGMLEIDHIRE